MEGVSTGIHSRRILRCSALRGKESFQALEGVKKTRMSAVRRGIRYKDGFASYCYTVEFAESGRFGEDEYYDGERRDFASL